MVSLIFALVFLGGPPVLKAGDVVQVPDHFYRRLERVEELPPSCGTLGWREARIGNWVDQSTARGAAAVQAIEARLGAPLKLPAWGPIPPREAYAFAMRTSLEAGLLIVVDRDRAQVDLKTYRSIHHPFNSMPAKPPSNEWEMMLITWFRWLTTPDDALSPEQREAVKHGFPPVRATGKDPFAGW